MDDQHAHDDLLHEHDHVHVTHYVRPGEEATHLSASHSHQHNHPAVTHDHEAHENWEKEHGREGHIHDHAQPTESPG